jgi:hypothetical protein
MIGWMSKILFVILVAILTSAVTTLGITVYQAARLFDYFDEIGLPPVTQDTPRFLSPPDLCSGDVLQKECLDELMGKEI